MRTLRIAAATRHFNQPLKLAIETAADMGVQGLQIDARHELRPAELSESGRRQFKHELSERLMTLASFEYPTRRALTDPEDIDARIAGLKAVLDCSYSLGVTTVVARIGRIPEDVESEKYHLLVDVLNDIARQSNKVGTILAVTPTIESVEPLKTLFEKITEGPLGLHFDPAGLLMNGCRPLEVYRELHDRVLTVQLRDGLRDIDGQGIEVPVGRGEIAWDELLALLDDGQFGGWFVATRSQGEDRIGDMARAIRFLRQVAAG